MYTVNQLSFVRRRECVSVHVLSCFFIVNTKLFNKNMDLLKNNWFTESCEMWPGGTFSLEVKEVLHSEKSQYQNIHVFDTTSFGRVLVLDGIIQCTQKDEFSYQASYFTLFTYNSFKFASI